MPARIGESGYDVLYVERRALDTASLRQAQAQLGELAARFFKPEEAGYVYDEETFEESLSPGHRRSMSSVAVPAVNVYKPYEIAMTLFERQAPLSMKMSRTFDELRRWVSRSMHPIQGAKKGDTQPNPFYAELRDAAERFAIDDPNRLKVTGIALAPTHNPDHAVRGQEYGLTLGPSPEALYLFEEADIIFRAVSNAPSSKRVTYPNTRTVISVPLFCLPPNADPDSTIAFLDCVHDDYMPRELTLGGKVWDNGVPIVVPS